MDPTECLTAIGSLAENGWLYRNLLIATGPITPNLVRLEDALHALEASMAGLAVALGQEPPNPPRRP